MAIARDDMRRVATVGATPQGVIILTALAAIPDVLPELGVDPGAVSAVRAVSQRGAVGRRGALAGQVRTYSRDGGASAVPW